MNKLEKKKARTGGGICDDTNGYFKYIYKYNWGLIIKKYSIGIAGASFALVTAIMVATATLPKYRHGRLHLKVMALSKVVSEGGGNAELEGNEFVMKREAVVNVWR